MNKNTVFSVWSDISSAKNAIDWQIKFLHEDVAQLKELWLDDPTNSDLWREYTGKNATIGELEYDSRTLESDYKILQDELKNA